LVEGLMLDELRNTEQRILCVQGDTGVVEPLLAALEDFQVSSAGTGVAALNTARDSVFDLYLVAEQLADMHGTGLCAEIRRFDPHTPILLCVHTAQEFDSARPDDGASVQGYISNPVETHVASEIIKNALRRSHERSTKAKAAMLRAVELEIFRRLHTEDSPVAKDIRLLANEPQIMSRAYEAFTEAGGARADFKRMWPTVFREACDKAG
jgi:DNA-binding response OmpR family regulator